jgi:hypothetical protein
VVATMPDFTPDEERMADRLLEAMEEFLKHRQTMPIHLVTALLRVALNPGQKVITHSRDSGESSSLTSRHLSKLGSKKTKDAKDPMGLVDKRYAPTSLRDSEVFLTPEGRELLKKVARILLSARTDDQT